MSKLNHDGITLNNSEATIIPFQINIPQKDIDDLRTRIAQTRWPAQLPGGG